MAGKKLGRGLSGPIRTSSKLLQQLFQHIETNDMMYSEVARKLGIEHNRLSYYRLGKVTPSVLLVEELAQVLGFEIVIKPFDVEEESWRETLRKERALRLEEVRRKEEYRAKSNLLEKQVKRLEKEKERLVKSFRFERKKNNNSSKVSV